MMRNAATVLGVIQERGRRGLPMERLYRQLFNPQLFLLAYGRIYANTGAMTPGVTPETVDGMSLAKIEAIIDVLRRERYRWRPVKRVHIPKSNGGGEREWVAPEAGEIELSAYGRRWIAERKLASRTRQGYEFLFARQVVPYLGHLMLGGIKPATIRAWRKKLLDAGVPEPQAVKAYALLRAILNTAAREDEIIRQNPCRIKGYDQYHTPERPTATIAQVYALADAMPARFSALVVVAALSALRWGELVALRRRDLDLDSGTVRVTRKLAALRSHLEFGPPKSAAGVRVVAVPAAAVEALRAHLAEFTALGLPGFHFHDLRHTGNTLAAASGASTRELMQRMGHASMRAALIYQHATSERDREIASAMDRRIAGHTRRKGDPNSSAAGPTTGGTKQ
ncbi:site-specific integrase [Micromonospora sp. NBC_00898]|uniref:tyrosine-type recombinase/integrase n=1 Tax=Micromonospora sp. NBC_00898 TaxID=2975981 RepID=UPI003869FD68|nr:site-specific integrase [Micromonospora sp. NBC_00898]